MWCDTVHSLVCDFCGKRLVVISKVRCQLSLHLSYTSVLCHYIQLPYYANKYDRCNTTPYENPLSRFLLRWSVSSNIGNSQIFLKLKLMKFIKCKKQPLFFFFFFLMPNSLMKNVLVQNSFLSRWEFREEKVPRLVGVSVALGTSHVTVFCEPCETHLLSQALLWRMEEAKWSWAIAVRTCAGPGSFLPENESFVSVRTKECHWEAHSVAFMSSSRNHTIMAS